MGRTTSQHEHLTGPELVDAIAHHCSLDLLLDRDPHAEPYTDDEWLALITLEREARKLFHVKEEKKRMKKQGIEDVEPAQEDGE